MNNELRERSKLVNDLLLEAREVIGNCSGSVESINDEKFIEYLAQNELELALDELEAISDDLDLTRDFWQRLLKAANAMELKEHTKRYLRAISYYG